MHDELCCCDFDGRVTRVVYDDTHQWLLESCVKFSQTAVAVEIFISKLSNRRRKGNIDLPCISVCDETGFYDCPQIVAYPSSKRFVKALRIGIS